MTQTNSADIEAARLLLARLGVSVTDLLATAAPPTAVPTFAEYVPIVSAAVGAGTRRVYSSYWNRLVEHWGARRLDEPTPTEIRQLTETLKTALIVRRNARGGRSATEHFIAALRCVYTNAENDGLINPGSNPALKVAKPRRLTSTRQAIPDAQLAEINRIAAMTGNDPALDTLILRLHTETACRRGGALALTPNDLDATQCLIRLSEKGETVRWQPVSPTLMSHLLHHAESRSTPPNGQLLRYANGRPITKRRYDHLWDRIGRHLPWVATQQISTHWLRHTTLTWVERNYGYATARAFAGHTDAPAASTTATYVKATLPEIAQALSTLTGEPHPLANS
ncbi:tyrosine-type recombinase/integrase [Kribbella sp. CA-294648]|uniref:tyrosine-type recombinase/integrase n=1 Tax=Kribbella sp. CA-294648 TaxID=3239948 RepID=UPI003D94BB3B